MYSDSHSHVDGYEEGQLTSILEAAKAQGVQMVVGVGTTLEASEITVGLSRRFAMIIPAVGMHPWWAILLDGGTSARLRQLASQKGVAAIGEVGIELELEPIPPRDLQWQLFRDQVALARELGLPLLLHCRGARDEMMELLRGRAPWRGVLHGFTGDPAEAQAWMALGLHIGVGLRALTLNLSPTLEEAIRAIPLDRMLLETDSSVRSYASEGHQPARVLEVAQWVARLKGVTPEEVGRRTTASLKALLRMPPP